MRGILPHSGIGRIAAYSVIHLLLQAVSTAVFFAAYPATSPCACAMALLAPLTTSALAVFDLYPYLPGQWIIGPVAALANSLLYGSGAYLLYDMLLMGTHTHRGGCLRCGYSLMGLTRREGHVTCPECGCRQPPPPVDLEQPRRVPNTDPKDGV